MIPKLASKRISPLLRPLVLPALGVALGLLTACSHKAPALQAPEKPEDQAWLDPDVDYQSWLKVEPARIEKVPTELITSGTVTFSDLHVSHVFSPVSGRITSLIANLGQHVRAGDPLCAIDSPDLGSAYSDMVKAHADLIAAKADFDRQQALLAQGAAAQAQVEQSKDSYEKAVAEYQRAQRKVLTLHADPDAASSSNAYVLRAPIAGQIVARGATLGFEVQGMLSGASVATELYTIGDLDEVWAMLDIYERDLGQVEVGDVVHLKVAAYDQTFDGKLEYISQVVDPTSHTVKVRAVVPNPGDLLKADMFTKAVIDTGVDTVLAVPVDSVLLDDDQYIAFVQEPGNPLRFARTPVQVKIEGMWAEIRGGSLKPGDVVAVRGATELLGML